MYTSGFCFAKQAYIRDVVGMNEQPLISVIIPVFNDQKGVLRCIKAISLQSFPADSVEVVVVDNGSTPPITVGEAVGLKVRLIRCEKPGSYAARNAGVKVAGGDYYSFIDADCWPHKDWLKYGLETLSESGDKKAVGGEAVIVEPVKRTAVGLYQYLVGFDQESNIKEKKFTGVGVLFCSRKFFLSVGLFNEDLLSGGDREWSWRAFKKGFTIVYEPRSVIYTEPRTTLIGAIRQARRIAAGRKMLKDLGLAHVGDEHINKKRTISQSVGWILSRKEIGVLDRVRVLFVAVVIRAAEAVERLRLIMGARAERR